MRDDAPQLLGDGLPDMRVIVPVAGGPPGRDAVDESPAVGERDEDAVRRCYEHRRRCGLHLRVGQPDVFEPVGKPIRLGRHGGARAA